MGSAVPWKARMGSGWPRHGVRYSSPSTGAIALIFLDSRHPSRDDIWAPLEIPVEKTSFVLTQRVDSRWSMSAETKSTSWLSAVGAASQYGVPLESSPEGATPMKSNRGPSVAKRTGVGM